MLSRSFTLLCLTALVGTAVAADTTVTTVILKETVTQAAPTATATQEQNNTPPPPPPNSHPFPQAFPGQGFMPPPGFQPPLLSMGPPPPAVQPGSIVSPFAAVLCVLTVAGCYWAFKFLPNMQPGAAAPAPAAGAEAKDGKEKATEAGSAAAMPMVTPTAFIALILFALLAAVIIQGPLGLSLAFDGKSMDAAAPGSSSAAGGIAIPQLLQMLAGGTGQSAPPPAQTSPESQQQQQQVGGSMKAAGPNGAMGSNWYITEGDTNRGGQAQPRANPILSAADHLILASLPPLLQGLPACRTNPSICSTLLNTVDSNQVAAILGGIGTKGSVEQALGQPPVPQHQPVPLIPKNGFLNSYQGLKSIENLFFPLLIGAIGLIVLFDYGT